MLIDAELINQRTVKMCSFSREQPNVATWVGQHVLAKDAIEARIKREKKNEKLNDVPVNMCADGLIIWIRSFTANEEWLYVRHYN